MGNCTIINYEGEDMREGANNYIKEKISTKNTISFSVYTVFTYATVVTKNHKINLNFQKEIQKSLQGSKRALKV